MSLVTNDFKYHKGKGREIEKAWDKRHQRENPIDTSFEEIGGRLRRSLAWGLPSNGKQAGPGGRT